MLGIVHFLMMRRIAVMTVIYGDEGYGHIDILRVLLARGADIGWKDKNGQNSLQGECLSVE
jgi:ankyrin repeat protein